MKPENQKLNREAGCAIENLNLINDNDRQTLVFHPPPEIRSNYDNEAFLSDNDENYSDRPRQLGRRSNPVPRAVSVATGVAEDGNRVSDFDNWEISSRILKKQLPHSSFFIFKTSKNSP